MSDQERAFVKEINEILFSHLKTEYGMCSAYHPQFNGMVERFNQTLQLSLIKMTN